MDLIGRIVRFHRKKARLTQKELAELAQVGKTAVFDIEKGKPTVRLSTLMSVLAVLSIAIRLEGPFTDRFENEKS